MPELPEGATLVVLDHDYGPATKILPTLEAKRGSNEPLIYCDDDRIAHPNFVSDLLAGAQKKPGCILANSGWDLEKLGVQPKRETGQVRAKRLKSIFDVPYRLRRLRQDIGGLFSAKSPLKPNRSRNFWRLGALDIMEGMGGVLLYSDSLDDDVFNVPAKVWTVDDIWLSGMAAKKGTIIWANNSIIPDEIAGAEVDALCNDTIEGLNRAQANLECVRVLQRNYGVWAE
ncbi:hypothetical protein [Phaeobacter italicus]|uniref:hypothetical protein n=1 Tax=Phaeobacter italicus TaxID=481446 RepID=UPI00248E912C|nr:hypothetical protein [Phaeobacter italicus]